MLELGPPTLCKPVASPFLLLAAAWGCHLILGTWLISGHLVGEPQCPYRMRQTFPLFTSGQQDGFSSMNFPVVTWAPCEAYTSSFAHGSIGFQACEWGAHAPPPLQDVSKPAFTHPPSVGSGGMDSWGTLRTEALTSATSFCSHCSDRVRGAGFGSQLRVF